MSKLKGALSKRVKINKEELHNLYITKKMSSIKIGRIFDCSNVVICNRLRKFGILIRPRKLDIKRVELYSLYITKKLSAAKIGKISGCGFAVILSRLRKFGIPIRPRKLDIKRGELYSLYITKKLSSADIGKIFNCSYGTILSRLGKFGIPIRDRSGANKNPSKELVRLRLRRRIPSSLEVKFQSIIDKHDLPYKYVGNGEFILGHLNPDFINTNSEKVAIEVYARYYKRRNKISIEEWKKKRTQVFKSYGWKLLFFDETEVTEKNVLKAISA